MTCDELLHALNGFVDGETATPLCQRFAAHLAQCNPCQVVVDNIRQTITLYRDGQAIPMPQDLQDCLKQSLRARWAQRFPSSKAEANGQKPS